ncbi:MAG: alpha/beta hydrolase [Anaerolineae bacterium]|nr:alpha/beta hydrolase [Anaerolineae bacterium]NUQ07022.1 alpha/beta hydrolase [Anaerolineae bacterium]
MRKLVILTIFVLLNSTLSVLAQDAFTPQFEPVENCFVPLPAEIDYDCGYVGVPDFYTGESIRELQLGIVRLNTSSDTPGTPLFMLLGGPGESIATPLSVIPTLLGVGADPSAGVTPFARILQNHDIIFMTQRGTEFSTPFLTCPEIGGLAYIGYEQQLDQDASEALFADTLSACVARHEADGVDFNAFNSEASAADVVSVAEALGYDRIIYYGESYGAQLGQFVMRDHPDILEAVILDGANPLSKTSWVQDRAQSFQSALDTVATMCAERPDCAAAFGDLHTSIDAIAAQFSAGPIAYTFQDPENPDVSLSFNIGLGDVAIYLAGNFDLLHNFLLPLTIHQLAEGNLEVVGLTKATNILQSQGASSNSALLMQLSIVCSDDPVFADSEADSEGVSELAIAAGRGEAAIFRTGCSVINVQQLPESSDVDVSRDIPTLLFSGGLDTRTPTARNQEVADRLPNSRVIVFPTGAHVQVPNIPCANELLADFVADPSSLDSLDESCAATLLEGFQFITSLDE